MKDLKAEILVSSSGEIAISMEKLASLNFEYSGESENLIHFTFEFEKLGVVGVDLKKAQHENLHEAELSLRNLYIFEECDTEEVEDVCEEYVSNGVIHGHGISEEMIGILKSKNLHRVLSDEDIYEEDLHYNELVNKLFFTYANVKLK